MAINAKQVVVKAAAPVRLDPTKPGQMVPRGAVIIRNRGNAAIFLGDSTVTTVTGYQLDAGEAMTADLYYGDALYGISGDGDQPCHIFQVGGAG